ncbi:MAG: shikimate dehydrogenase [Acidimicrobiia bacterium]|nr:shikimate dehydrogenase [Acidimicrobiia bacterium]
MTHRVALIGNPLKRRHSAVMHNAAFAAHGIDASFELRPIGPGDLDSFFAEARGQDWLGFGVTAPYKQAAMDHLDEIEAGALAIGAVNNGVRRDGGALVGFNTDASGFMAAVAATGASVAGYPAVVVGAGGAARAVVWALLDAGVEKVLVANRTPDYGTVEPAPLEGRALAQALGSAAIAVNATTMGMTTDTIALDVAALPETALVFDLVYVPPETPLVRAASARGLAVCNGLEMLVRQGEVAFERWTGIGSTADIMRIALESWIPESETER